MKLVENVFEIAESFMSDPKHVFLNNSKIELVADTIKKTDKPVFPFPDKGIDTFPAIVRELVAASINYCYWYGKDTVRPNGAGSTRMYELLGDAFEGFKHADVVSFSECLQRFGKMLSKERFPLIEERIGHLKQLAPYGIEYCIQIENRYGVGYGPNIDIEFLMNELVENFPGFASDIFLKRATLFFIQLHRRFGWFDDELHLLHVPADYQVPKMLEHFGCFSYAPVLKMQIETNQHVPKNSLEECEIRAATILTVKKLCELTGWNVSDIDSFFFLNRHSATHPFHLTITTDC